MSEACAYLVSRYPGVTHTFIVGEVRALRAAGVRVEPVSVRRVGDDELLGEVDREEQRRTHALLPVSPGALLAAHARAAGRAPGGYLRTLARALRMAHAGGRPRLWQAFYFAEAVLLWSWMRSRGLHHVHVHHANVAADVAMLACGLGNAAGPPRRWTWSITIHGPTELLDVTAHKLAVKVADAAAVLCTSDYARSQVAALLAPDDLERVHTVRSGIDTAAFRPRDGAAAAGSGEPPVILCTAALSRRKGHAVLLDALARVLGDGRAARLVIAGDGPERDSLRAQADALGVTDHVEFLGAVSHDRVAELTRRADVFCLPSFAEGVPTAVQEAMAAELPVVATDVFGIPELVEHEHEGLLVPPARDDLLAAALTRLLDDPELRRRLGREARARVQRDYERTRCVARLREVLAPLISDDAGTSRSA